YSNMHFKALLVLCGILSIAAANPTQVCKADSKHNKASCCTDASFLGVDLIKCVPILSSGGCNAGATAYCCQQQGLINVGLCVPINA
ncbi:hypothetical protein BGZ91_008034, partial [Linnemannia elongata]